MPDPTPISRSLWTLASYVVGVLVLSLVARVGWELGGLAWAALR